MKEEDKNEGVTIGKFASEAEMSIVKGLLESNGIECFTLNTSFGNIYPGLNVNSSVDMELVVRKEDYEKAEMILKAKFDKKDVQ